MVRVRPVSTLAAGEAYIALSDGRFERRQLEPFVGARPGLEKTAAAPVALPESPAPRRGSVMNRRAGPTRRCRAAARHGYSGSRHRARAIPNRKSQRERLPLVTTTHHRFVQSGLCRVAHGLAPDEPRLDINQCSHHPHSEEARSGRNDVGHQRSHSNPGPGVGAASLDRPGPGVPNASHTPRGSRHETCPSPVCALATAAMTLLFGPAWGGGAHSSTDPAVPDTLNIEFHWLDREPSLAERAMMERAGRSWSTPDPAPTPGAAPTLVPRTRSH